jgi:hypothetical protein
MADDWSKYVALHDSGWTPLAVWKQSESDGLSTFESVRMIRSVYSLSLAGAKEVMLHAAGIEMSLAEY